MENFLRNIIRKIFLIKFGSFKFWTSFILTGIFFLQSTKGGFKYAGFLYFGDVIELWIPQLMNSIYQNINFNFFGIDFYTHGGASEYFLRPNIMVFHPFILIISYIIGKACTLKIVFNVLVILYIISSYLSCFFTQKLCDKFFGFDKYLSLFVAVNYTFSIYFVKALGYTPFVLIAWLIPVVIYLSLNLTQNFSLKNIFLYSFFSILILVSGYVTLSLFAIFICLLFVFIYLLYINPDSKNKEDSIINFLKAASPSLIASLICAPLYLAMANFHATTSTSESSVFWSAHMLAEKPFQILRLISHYFSLSGSFYEQCIVWGILPLIIIILLFFNIQKITLLKLKEIRLLKISLCLYFILILSIFGEASVVSDLFYYLLPIIGKMHIYQRHLLSMHLFFVISLALFLKVILLPKISNKTSTVSWARFLLLFIIITTVIASFYTAFKLHPEGTFAIQGGFIVELFLGILFLIILNIFFQDKSFIILSITFFTFLIPLENMYNLSTNKDLSPQVQREKLMYFNPAINDIVVSYFKNNSNKPIVKYINLLPKYHDSYIGQNYPWFVQNQIILSTYHGYEPHMAASKDFLRDIIQVTMKDGKHTFIPDWNWLKKTGAEFVIFKTDASYKYPLLNQYTNLSNKTKVLNLPHNIVIAPLKFLKNKNLQHTVFDNGYIQIISKDKKTQIKSFKTNNANRLTFSISSTKPTQTRYLFWPNKRLKVYVNGVKKNFGINDGTQDKHKLLTLDLEPGKYNVKIIYKNNTFVLFLVLYFGYLFIITSILLQSIWRRFYKPSKQIIFLLKKLYLYLKNYRNAK